MSFEGGPGGWTFVVGLVLVGFYVVGGTVGSSSPEGPAVALWWSALGLLAAVIFMATSR